MTEAAAPQVRRRLFLVEPGEEPLLNTDPVELMHRFERFVDATGLAPERVLCSPVVKVPLPVAVRGADGVVKRWAVDPEAMWLPLFWLPPRVGLRYEYKTIDAASGGTNDDLEIESDETWAIRVMLELMYAGLFNVTDGTWADVLFAYGIDVENPVDQARIQVWLDGGADETLDNIDLTDSFDNPDDPHWALSRARELADTFIPAAWSLSAGGILTACAMSLATEGESDQSRRDVLAVLGRLASVALRTIPADEDGLTTTEVIEAIVEESVQPGADLEDLVDGFMQALAEISEDFRPHLDAVVLSEQPAA